LRAAAVDRLDCSGGDLHAGALYRIFARSINGPYKCSQVSDV
jgi:hypothetical protein